MLHWYCKATYNMGQFLFPKATYNLARMEYYISMLNKVILSKFKSFQFRLNTSFGPLTYFSFSIRSLNYKVSQFGLINLMPFTILVLSVSILQNLLTPSHMSFKIGDQRLDLKSTQAFGGLTTYLSSSSLFIFI